jgi:hypothetical protein
MVNFYSSLSLPFSFNSYCSVGLRSLLTSSLSGPVKIVLFSKYLSSSDFCSFRVIAALLTLFTNLSSYDILFTKYTQRFLINFSIRESRYI